MVNTGSDLGVGAVGRICGTLFKGGSLVIWLATTQRRGEVGSNKLNGSSAVRHGPGLMSYWVARVIINQSYGGEVV